MLSISDIVWLYPNVRPYVNMGKKEVALIVLEKGKIERYFPVAPYAEGCGYDMWLELDILLRAVRHEHLVVFNK